MGTKRTEQRNYTALAKAGLQQKKAEDPRKTVSYHCKAEGKNSKERKGKLEESLFSELQNSSSPTLAPQVLLCNSTRLWIQNACLLGDNSPFTLEESVKSEQEKPSTTIKSTSSKKKRGLLVTDSSSLQGTECPIHWADLLHLREVSMGLRKRIS